MRLQTIYVTPRFRNELVELAPQFFDSKEARLILSLLLFPVKEDFSFGEGKLTSAVFSAEILSAALGKSKSYYQNNFALHPLLTKTSGLAASNKQLFKSLNIYGPYNSKWDHGTFYGEMMDYLSGCEQAEGIRSQMEGLYRAQIEPISRFDIPWNEEDEAPGPGEEDVRQYALGMLLMNSGRAKATVVQYEPAPQLAKLLDLELTEWQHQTDRLVSLVSGRKRPRRKSKAERDERLQAIRQNIARQEANDLTKKFLSFFNGLPPNIFTKLVTGNYEGARQLAVAEKSDSKRRRMLRDLLQIKQQPQVLYNLSAKGSTSRIFGDGTSLVTVDGNLRRALTQGCYECDLVSSQLAIIAWRWDIPHLQEFLRSGKSVWEELSVFLNLNIEGEIKKAIKNEYLYPIVYGRSTKVALREIKKWIQEKYIPTATNKERGLIWRLTQLNRFPLFKGITRERDKQRRRIRKAGYIDLFLDGRVYVEEEMARTGKGKTAVLKSFLARDAQDVELWLMEPIIDIGQKSEDFSIVLHQHDGMTIQINKADRVKQVQERLSKAIKERGDSKGIHAVLEWK